MLKQDVEARPAWQEIKQYDMLRRGRKGKNEIPIRVSTYEYD